MNKDISLNFFTNMNNCTIIRGNVINNFSYNQRYEGSHRPHHPKDEYEDAIIVEETEQYKDTSPNPEPEDDFRFKFEEDSSKDHLKTKKDTIKEITDRFTFESEHLDCPLAYNLNAKPTNEHIKQIFRLIFGIDIERYPFTPEEQEIANHLWKQLKNKESRTTPVAGEHFNRIRVANILGFLWKSEQIILLEQKKLLKMVFGVEKNGEIVLDENEYNRLRRQMNMELEPDKYNQIFPKKSDQFIRKCIKSVFSGS